MAVILDPSHTSNQPEKSNILVEQLVITGAKGWLYFSDGEICKKKQKKQNKTKNKAC